MELIKNLLDKYVKSVNECDVELAALFWDNEDGVSFIHPNGYEHSFEEVKQHFYLQTMGMFSKRDLRLKDIKARTFGEIAFLEFRWDFYAEFKDSGEKIHTQGRETQFLILRNGEWKISNIHYSLEPQA